VHTYLIPCLGALTLDTLTVGQIQAMFTDIAGHQNRHGRPVSVTTLHRLRATLRRALNIAVREQLLGSNPTRQVVLPRPPRPRPQAWTDARIAAWRDHSERPAVAVWTPAQLATFLAAVRGDALFALWWLVALRGLRRGEVCGLRWVDVDLTGKTLTVCRQVTWAGGRIHIGPVKTPSGERAVALDSATVALLRWHRDQQDKLRRVMGTRWRGGDWVFTLADGRPIHPDWLTHRFRVLVAASGLPPVRLHDLRHGAGSLALAVHVDMKIVQDMLGHASYAYTADTYTLVLPEVAYAAAEATAHLILTELANHHASAIDPPQVRRPLSPASH
jgi:integrase